MESFTNDVNQKNQIPSPIFSQNVHLIDFWMNCHLVSDLLKIGRHLWTSPKQANI